MKRGKLPWCPGHSCIYTAQKTNTEKCSGAQSFSAQPVRILKRRGDKPPSLHFLFSLFLIYSFVYLNALLWETESPFRMGFKGISWAARAVG